MNTRNRIILWYLSTGNFSTRIYKRDILWFYQKIFIWQKMLKTFTSKRPFDICHWKKIFCWSKHKLILKFLDINIRLPPLRLNIIAHCCSKKKKYYWLKRRSIIHILKLYISHRKSTMKDARKPMAVILIHLKWMCVMWIERGFKNWCLCWKHQEVPVEQEVKTCGSYENKDVNIKQKLNKKTVFSIALFTLLLHFSSLFTRIMLIVKRISFRQRINPSICRMNKMQCIDSSREPIQSLLQHKSSVLVVFQSCFTSQTSWI